LISLSLIATPKSELIYFVEIVTLNNDGDQTSYETRQMPRKLAEKYQAICKLDKITFTEKERLIILNTTKYKLKIKQFRKKYKRCDIVKEYPL